MALEVVGKNVGDTGFGLMGLSTRDTPSTTEHAIKVMKVALESGCNYWNGGEFYGSPEHNSLHLLHAYFTKYPEDADKVVLNIKGGLVPGQMKADGKEANVRRSVDECNRILAGTKKIDTFECARQDPDTSVEETVGVLAQLVEEGKISSISLSEVSANTIRRAAKVHKIESVEQEFSLFAKGILSNGVAQACAELDIPILAYSPLGKGYLTGQFKTYDDVLKSGNTRLVNMAPRFSKESFEQNRKLVEAVEEIATKKGCTVGQVAMGWIKAHSGRKGMPIIIPIPGATREERVQENSKDVAISDEEMEQLDRITEKFPVHGARVPAFIKHMADGLE